MSPPGGPTTALVIGGTGPTGPHVVDGLLARGMDVTVLNRGGRPVRFAGAVEQVVADPHVAESLASALRHRSFDVVVATYGRLRLMPPILRECTGRLVTVGGTAYAELPAGAAVEDSPRDLVHTIVRRMVETEQTLSEAHAAGDFVHTHLRFPLLWGPGQIAPKEWSIVRRVLDGRAFIPVVDGGRTLESKCFVTTAAAAVLLAVDRPGASAGRTYNVADAETPDDATRVRDLCAALGRPEVRLVNLPQTVHGPGGFWGVGRDLDAAVEGRPASTRHRLISSDRIRDELGLRDVVPYAMAVDAVARHCTSWPLERGGEAESTLADAFDYAAEDRFAEELERFHARAAAIGFTPRGFRHQYDHPPTP